jgi:hypothetical protein
MRCIGKQNEALLPCQIALWECRYKSSPLPMDLVTNIAVIYMLHDDKICLTHDHVGAQLSAFYYAHRSQGPRPEIPH